MFYAIALTVGLLATFFTHGVAEYISTCGRPMLLEDPTTRLPMLSSICSMKSGRAICSELAINQCYQNSNGDLFGTIK